MLTDEAMGQLLANLRTTYQQSRELVDRAKRHALAHAAAVVLHGPRSHRRGVPRGAGNAVGAARRTGRGNRRSRTDGSRRRSTALAWSDAPRPAIRPRYATYKIVSPRYFAAAGTPLLWGRDFVERDTADSPPDAIVNAAIASKYWPGQDPIGKQVGLPIAAFNMTIVGVAPT
jgi:MacB-like periplasmic core domain